MNKLFKSLVTAFYLASTAMVFAATTPNSLIYPQNVAPSVQTITPADNPGTPKAIVTGSSNGTKCTSLWLSWTDQTVAHSITIQFTIGAKVGYLGTFSTTIGLPAHTIVANPINIFSPQILGASLSVDTAGNSYIFLNSADTMQANYTVPVTTSDTLTFTAMCQNF